MGLNEDLHALVGGGSGEPVIGLDEVNAPMIRHMVWRSATPTRSTSTRTQPGAVRHPGIVAPPTMLQTWSMAGLDDTRPPGSS
jgi:hypothetical protein